MATTSTPNPTLHHINLKTVRLQEMIDWYARVVGIEPTHRFEGGAWLSNDAANHRLALLTIPGMEDDPDKIRHTGIHHTAFEYPSMHDLLDTYTRLKEHEILPHACLDHGMTMSFYYVDPDGNSVELQYDQYGAGPSPRSGCTPPPSSPRTRSESTSTLSRSSPRATRVPRGKRFTAARTRASSPWRSRSTCGCPTPWPESSDPTLLSSATATGRRG